LQSRLDFFGKVFYLNMVSLQRQVLRFGITGVVNTLIDFGLFNILIFISGIHSGWQLGLINFFSVGVAVTNSYLMNRSWTFQSTEGKHRQQAAKFIIASGIGMFINSLAVTAISALAPWLPVSIYLVLNAGKLLGAVFSSTWNFVIYRIWVFKSSGTKPADSGPEYTPGLVSIVIPAYNEASRLPRRLRRLAEAAAERFPVEILVVDDGSADDTLSAAQEIAADFPFVRCLSHPRNMGKGSAVRTGVLDAHGEFVVFVDADETFSLDHIEQIAAALQSGHQVAIASRDISSGQRIAGESRLRRLMGKSFNFLVRWLVLPGCYDTQCGLKGFRCEAARKIFIRQKMHGFAFDVEILALARALNFDLVRVPVQAVDCEGSSVNRLLSPLQMAWDLVRIKAGLILHIYQLPGTRQWWSSVIIGFGLFITALAVRLPWLWQFPRYIDELKEVNLAYSIYAGKALPLTNFAHDIGSMHNYILAGIFKLLGPSIFWPRLYVAITAALTVVLIYRLGERWFDRSTGLLAAGLLLTNGMHIMVTHMAWANCTTPFFFLLAMLATMNAEKHKSGPWLVGAALLWAATLQTHSSVIIYVLAALIYVFSPHFRRTSAIKPVWYLRAAGAFILGYGNMIYYNIISRGGSITWLSRKDYALESEPGLTSFANNLQQMFIELIRSVSSTYTESASLLGYLAHPIFSLSLLLLVYGSYVAYKKKGQTLLQWMIAGGFLVIPWINHRYTFYLATRYIMPLVLCALVLISYGTVVLLRKLVSQEENARTLIVPITAVVMALIALQLVPFYNYCEQANSTNLTNQMALQIMTIVNGNDQDKTRVLVDNELELENEPLPYLLTLNHNKFAMIPSISEKTNKSSSADAWLEAVNKYHSDELIAVMSSDTYLQTKDTLPVIKTYTLSAQVAFPEALTTPRLVYVVKMKAKPPVYYQDQAIVLLYHDFCPKERGTAITPERFAAHLDMLDQEGFNIIPLDDVIQFVKGNKKLPPNALAITMDDGYLSNYKVAFPLLKERNWPATFFVKVADTEKSVPSLNKRQWMSWGELQEMSKNNMTVYSHTYDGHSFIRGDYPKGDAWLTSKLPGETEANYQQRIYHDLSLSQQIIKEKLNNTSEHFAYPFGMYNQSVLDACKKAGYKYIWTTQRVPVKANSSLESLGRVSVGIGGTTPEQLKSIILEVAKR